LDAPTQQIAERIGPSEHIVFVLADGLGMNLVEARPLQSFLRRHLAMELRSVFPSSTAPALTSLATGTWPAEHGLPAWFLYLTDQRLQVISLPFVERFTKQAVHAKLAPALYSVPALMPGFKRDTELFQHDSIADSVYTRYIGGGRAALPYSSLPSAINGTIARVQAASGPTYTYLYYGGIDAAAHPHGPFSVEVVAEVDMLEQQLERLAGETAGQARIVVSADHGLYEVQPDAKPAIEPDDELCELLLTPPSGEARVPIFHCRPGAPGEFSRRFEARFGEAFALLSPDDVESLRLIGPGPLSAVTRSRLGDFIAVSAGGEGIVYGPDREVAAMKGFHGGLSAEEVRIPLVVA
jgi:hypothetical protein